MSEMMNAASTIEPTYVFDPSLNGTNPAIYETRDTSIDFTYSSQSDLVSLATLCIWCYLIREFLDLDFFQKRNLCHFFF
jgi:hypothetical protein